MKKSEKDQGDSEQAPAVESVPEPTPEQAVSDDGVKGEWKAAGEFVDTTGTRRIELRIGSRMFTHKYEDATGRWVYRAD